MLHYQVKFRLGLDDFVELDDVRMPDDLEDVNLSGDPLDIIDVLDLCLLKYLDGHLLPRVDMDALLDFAEGPLSKCPFELVVSNLVHGRSLLRLLFRPISCHVLDEDGRVVAYGDEVLMKVHVMNYSN